LSALQEALDRGFDGHDMLQSDTDLNTLRSDPRFQQLLEESLHTDAGKAKLRGAVGQYESLKESDSDDASEWRSAGMTLLRSGEPNRAAEAFERQYRIDRSANAIYNRACAQAQARKTDEALATLQRAIEAGAGDGETLRKDADLIPLHRDPRFERLVRLATDFELYGRGSRDDDPGSWRAAMLRFERVAEEHPQVGRAWSNLGYARLRAQDARGSLEAYGHSLELDYRRPSTLYNLACAAALLGDRDAAMEWLEKAEAAGLRLEDIAPHDDDLDPLRSDARFRAMEDRWERGRETAKKHWKKDKRS
jgi:adenylate cyclase